MASTKIKNHGKHELQPCEVSPLYLLQGLDILSQSKMPDNWGAGSGALALAARGVMGPDWLPPSVSRSRV